MTGLRLGWVRTFGDAVPSTVTTAGNNDIVYGVAIDRQNNVYSIGRFEGAADLDLQNPGTVVFTAPNFPKSDIFLTKHDPQGNLLWARQMVGDQRDLGWGIVVDADGNGPTLPVAIAQLSNLFPLAASQVFVS